MRHSTIATLLFAAAAPAASLATTPPPAIAPTTAATAPTTAAGHPDFNFTGPLVTPSVNTMPAGMVNVEPYLIHSQTRALYDNAGHRHEMASETSQWQVAVPVAVAISDASLVQLTLNALRATGQGMHTDGFRMADTSLRVQQRLLAPAADGTGLVLAVSLSQRLSTGRYHQLNANPLNATGNGTRRTSVAVGGQALQWLDHDRAVRWRGQIAWSPAPGAVRVRNASVYGTADGFAGYALAGQAWSASMAAEFALNPRWVLVGEAVWNRSGPLSLIDTRTGVDQTERRLAPGHDVSLAPAVEYHFSSRMGLIAGVQFTVAGRNNSDYVAPQVALNMVF